MLPEVAQFVSRHARVPADSLDVCVEPLSGGLESRVVRATIRRRSGEPLGHWPAQFVVKELQGRQRREAAIYRELGHGEKTPVAVRLLGAETLGGSEFVYLEDAGGAPSWPWSNSDVAAAVCRALARWHEQPRIPPALLADWDYEAELRGSAEQTLALALSARDSSGAPHWRRAGDLRRVVAALPAVREQLLELGTTVIHGDIHPGNVIARVEGAGERICFLDWGRARLGSPFEDLASWLHSLGCWEPEARRRHDTLLRAYLDARDAPQPITAGLRIACAFASACNGLSGAIRYHLFVLGDRGAEENTRWHSQRALVAWERVIRRVAAILATTPAR